MERLKILVVAGGLPEPDKSAGERRFFAILQLLAKHHSVDFFPLHQYHVSANTARYKSMLEGININVLSKGKFFTNGLLRLGITLSRQVYDVVICEFWYNAEQVENSVRKYQPWAKMIVDTVDIQFLREEAGLRFGASNPEAVLANKNRELSVYRGADAVIAVTPEDQKIFTECQIDVPTFLVPIIVPFQERLERERKNDVLFIGGFNHPPNIDGLVWLVNKVWPKIKSYLADANLIVVGSNPSAEIHEMRKIPGVDVVGYVPDTYPYLNQAAVSVAPLRYGAGMKGKVVEAMAAGLPVVTTTFGAQGLAATNGTHLIIADAPEDFASCIISLLTNPSKMHHVGLAGQKHIQSICSVEVVEKQLLETIAAVTTSLDVPKTSMSLLLFLMLNKVSAWLRLISHYLGKSYIILVATATMKYRKL